MALSPNSTFRGVAAAICQPASEDDVVNQLSTYVAGLTLYNNNQVPEFRNAENDEDITEAVYRWDMRPPEEIFRTGFTPRPQGTIEAEDYYNFERFVNGAGIPADGRRADGSVFVSTTRSTSWRPTVTRNLTLYRYEIFAPGGIDAVRTLGDRNLYPNQEEISFAGGINPQYIRIALPFSVSVVSGLQYPEYTTLWNGFIRNGRFNPNPTSNGGWTSQEFLARLRNPTCPPSQEAMLKFTNMPPPSPPPPRHDEL